MKLKDWLSKMGLGNMPKENLPDSSVLDLIRYLENCEVDCEQAFHMLDQYAEMEIRKEDAARLMPLVHQHLEMCSGCNDHYEALLDVLAKVRESSEA
ncbi:MAG: hypothetical protein HY867_11025 [Chloroflexi bacterium]|nr:hypothetical protein [Chloroflexota bacterium]